MITLNGQKFAENESEFQHSLLTAGGTCNGYAKRLKRRIKIFNLKMELVGLINSYGVLCHASLTTEGQYWYCYATIPEIGKYESNSQERKEIEALAIDWSWASSSIECIERKFQFK